MGKKPMCEKRGCIVYNGFWNPRTPPDPVTRLSHAAERQGIQLEILPNTRLIASLGPGIAVSGTQADYALFWDKDIRLAKSLEASGVRLYNSAAAIETCDDKAATHLRLAGQRLPMPRTLVAPMTYRDITDAVEPFCETAENILGYPLVIKECYGSFGGQVFLARDGEELRRLARGREARPFLAQEFIASSAGEDIRLYMVGEECVAAMRRRSRGDFRANIGNGGKGERYEPTREEIRLASDCCRLLGLDFAGVDMLHNPKGKPLICEVNSNAFMAEITSCTGVDVAEHIIGHVLRCEQNGREWWKGAARHKEQGQ